MDFLAPLFLALIMHVTPVAPLPKIVHHEFKNVTQSLPVQKLILQKTSAKTSKITPLKVGGIIQGISVVDQISGKTQQEKVSIKSDVIMAQPLVGMQNDTKYGNMNINIQSITKIPGGVEILAQAWLNGNQLAFGTDGTVDIERFRIFNPPTMVPDGTFTTTLSPTGQTIQVVNYKEDPKDAVIQTLADAIRMGGKGNNGMIAGKVGHTTDIVYATSDAGLSKDNGAAANWSAAHDAASSNTTYPDPDEYIFSRCDSSGAPCYISRVFQLYDMSGIGTDQTASEATSSVFGNSKAGSLTRNYNVYVSTSASNPPSGSDYSACNCASVADNSPYSTDISQSSFSSSANNYFQFNATGLSALQTAITAGGNFKIVYRESNNDAPNTDPGVNADATYVSVRGAAASGTANDPKITIIHAASAATAVPIKQDLIIISKFVAPFRKIIVV